MTSRRLTIALALTAVLAAGCGSDPEPGPTPSPTPSAPSSSTATPTGTPSPGRTPTATNSDATTSLTVTYRPTAGAEVQSWTLTCSPAGGTLADPAGACDTLAENGEFALPATARGKVCAQVFGGEDVATVTGRWSDRRVAARFSRQNGCEISRWDALVGVLPVAGAR